MGCGPSKDSNVATGNTVSSKSLPEKKPDESYNISSPSTTITATAAKEDTDTKVDNGEGDVQAKDVGPVAPVAQEEEKEGKFVAVGSPDHYFSSRKDEEAVKGVTASTEIVDGESVAAAPEAAVNVEEGEAEKKVEDRNGGEEIMLKQEEGIASSKGSDDLKDSSLVETKETGVNVTENENENVSP